MTTPQPAALPEHTIGKHDHPEPHTMCWSELELGAIKRYAESYALAALQSQPAAPLRLDQIDLAPLKAELRDPAKAKAFLQKHGFLNASGELAEQYGGKPEQPAAAGVSDAVDLALQRAETTLRLYPAWIGLADDCKRARAILALRPQSPKAGADVASTWSAAGGWVPMCKHAATDRHYTGSLETLRRFAELLRPQAVPTLDLEAACIGYARLDGNEYKLASMRRNPVMDDGQLHPIYTFSDEVAEAHHGITAQGAQGGER